MKTTIKIHDTKWFETHCKVISRIEVYDELVPDLPLWEGKKTISWLSGDTTEGGMGSLEGRIVEVEAEVRSRDKTSSFMYGSQYKAGGYWIPNWAIEWVMEER